MRIAVVRGANLNPWELANFALRDADVVCFGSRRGAFAAHDVALPTRRLRSPADLVTRLPPLGVGAVGRFVGDTGYLGGLERALAGFDIAHTAELASPYSHQALRARRRGVVARVVATIWENIAFPAAPNRLVERHAREVAAGVDRFVAITERARAHLRHAGVPDERIEVIPMGVDLTRFTPAARAPSRDGGPLRVLSVCRLVAEKGVVDLLVAIGLLRDQGISAHLTLAGTGPLVGHLRAIASTLDVTDRVDLVGAVPYARLPALHDRADVFVLASAPRTGWQEQFGFAVVEAMACGLPVLAGDSGSLDEVVGDPGQLVAPHHPARLAAALAALAADPSRRHALGLANRARAEERYDRRDVAERLAGFYARALATAARIG